MPPTIQNFGIGCGKTDLLCSCQNKPFFHHSIPLRQDFCYLESSPFPPREPQILSTSSLTQNTSKMTIMLLAAHHESSPDNRENIVVVVFLFNNHTIIITTSKLNGRIILIWVTNILDLLSHIHYFHVKWVQFWVTQGASPSPNQINRNVNHCKAKHRRPTLSTFQT